MDMMMNSRPRPGATLPHAALAMALLAAALWAPLRPALAEDIAKSNTAERARVEERLKDAQQRMESAAREMAELSLSLSGGHEGVDRQIKVMIMKRPMLGMAIDMNAGEADAGQGVRVESVSPGGAAEAAGIRANDRVVALNGTALLGNGPKSAPQQLQSIMKAAKSGEPMAVEYRRDGKSFKAQIVPKESVDWGQDLDLPPLPEVFAAEGPDGGALRRVMRFRFDKSGGFGAVEMVDLSPALGSYFGTDKGLLVVRAPSDQRLKLQDGDVLLDIDGRVPGSAAHALQILESYRSGETVHLHVLRQKQRLELSVEVPEA